MAKRTPGRLLEELRAAKSTRKRSCWFDRLLSDQQAELTAVRQAWRAGELSHLPISEIWRRCSASIGVAVGRESFTTWLRKDDGDED